MPAWHAQGQRNILPATRNSHLIQLHNLMAQLADIKQSDQGKIAK
jgi:hypothetical protein